MMEEYKKMRTCLPPGLQFYPTDEELILCFLYYKAARLSYNYLDLIPDLDICLADPRHDQLKGAHTFLSVYMYRLLGVKLFLQDT